MLLRLFTHALRRVSFIYIFIVLNVLPKNREAAKILPALQRGAGIRVALHHKTGTYFSVNILAELALSHNLSAEFRGRCETEPCTSRSSCNTNQFSCKFSTEVICLQCELTLLPLSPKNPVMRKMPVCQLQLVLGYRHRLQQRRIEHPCNT